MKMVAKALTHESLSLSLWLWPEHSESRELAYLVQRYAGYFDSDWLVPRFLQVSTGVILAVKV